MPIQFGIANGPSARGPVPLERGWRQALAFALLVLSALISALPAAAAGPTTDPGRTAFDRAKIRLSQHGWGNTDPADLQFVLETVLDELGAHLPRRDLGTIAVVPGRTNPMVLFDKGPDGAYVVQLSARDGRWYQFVYQFSHELCHIYSNYDNKPAVGGAMANGNQWFEESLCEAAALFTLRRLATRWEAAPPAQRWASQAALFRQYADLLLSEPHRRLPPSYSFAAWFRDNHRALQGSPYLRDKDELVSNLLLPLFEQNPEHWGAIGYLNARREDATKRFHEYLEAWCLACPQAYRGVVEKIIALFGHPPAPSTVPTAPQTS